MSKQDCMTIKELEGKLEKSDIALLTNYIRQAVNHMEIMGANESDIIEGSQIKISKELFSLIGSADEQKKYSVKVVNNEIKIWCYDWDSWVTRYACSPENERELLAKGVILIFLVKALNDNGILEINEILLEDVLSNEAKTDFENEIEKLASRLLIPQSVFNDKLGHDIARLLYNEGKVEKELIDSNLERSILLAKLQSYGVNEKMAKVRLKIAVFDGEYTEDIEQWNLNHFTYYYKENPDEKELSKNMKKND